MKIIILGAGQVGSTLAENLARDNEITVVDTKPESLQGLQSRLDIRSVVGSGSYPDILEEAGVQDADVLIAVTSSDEINMIACQVAYTLFNTPTKIARIRASQYLNYKALFDPQATPIDVCIAPEVLVTNFVKRLIEYPGALQVLDFAQGKVQLVAVKPARGAQLLGKTVGEFSAQVGGSHHKVVAIYRGSHAIEISPDTQLTLDDELFFIAAQADIRTMLQGFGYQAFSYKRIVIGGAGNIGARLASVLEHEYQVKVMDHNAAHAEMLSQTLENSTILLGDVSDKELLVNENIDKVDVFCAVTNDDEANIMSALQAKRLGAKQVMALITRTAYVDLIEGSNIDVAISPQQATIGSLLTRLRRGDIVNVQALRRGDAETIEIIARGDESNSKVIGNRLRTLKLPGKCTVGAIVRGDQILIADDDLIVETDDHLIIFVEDNKKVRAIEKLFQVGVTFFQ